MTDLLSAWEQAHPAAARALWALFQPPTPPTGQGSEARVQSAVRLEAARRGWTLYRNNVGVLPDKRGVPLRFGLANDTSAMNAVIKSGDLIGMRPRLITSADVGATIGQFVSVEVKAERGVIHPAQTAWAALVNKRGGLGLIVNQEGMLP